MIEEPVMMGSEQAPPSLAEEREAPVFGEEVMVEEAAAEDVLDPSQPHFQPPSTSASGEAGETDNEGGANSLSEAATAGVPVLCLPFAWQTVCEQHKR